MKSCGCNHFSVLVLIFFWKFLLTVKELIEEVIYSIKYSIVLFKKKTSIEVLSYALAPYLLTLKPTFLYTNSKVG